MLTFIDAANRTWTISLNLGTAIAVKDALGVDLLQPEAGDPPLLTRLGTDEVLLGEVICALLGGQFDAQNVDEADVRASFDGATLMAAQKAFYEELVDFFQSRGRADRAKAVQTQMRMIDVGVATIAQRIDEIDVDEVIHEAMAEPAEGAAKTGLSERSAAKTDGAMSGSSPDSSAPTPGD